MKNPIINELNKLKLISKRNLIVLNERTRDKQIRVLKDLKTKIIFLEKNIASKDNYKDYLRKDAKVNIKKKPN